METTFRCTLCPLYISNIQYFGTKEKLDDHIALHELFDLGKLRRHFFETRNTGFYCSVCYYNNPAGAHMNTYAAAIAHFDMHEQIKRESSAIIAIFFIFSQQPIFQISMSTQTYKLL